MKHNRPIDWQQRGKRHDPRRRRGAMLVLIGLLLLVFMGAVAFSVDVAYMQLTRTQLRIATDAAARAAGDDQFSITSADDSQRGVELPAAIELQQLVCLQQYGGVAVAAEPKVVIDKRGGLDP